ncbi:hypothetical protein TNCV_1867591 [Trichonephila clavipes]|nr:hypothetical protein TNCV_1867591 [Trichonephila clavipes]
MSSKKLLDATSEQQFVMGFNALVFMAELQLTNHTVPRLVTSVTYKDSKFDSIRSLNSGIKCFEVSVYYPGF